MSLTRLLAVIRKESLYVLRDKRSLGAAILIPMVLMIIYCSSLSLDVNNIPIVVLDSDRTSDSRDFIQRFTSSKYFTVLDYVDNYKEMQGYIDKGIAVMGLSLSRNFSRDVRQNDRPVPVQVLIDGTDPNRGNYAAGYTQMITQNYTQQMLLQKLQDSGVTANNTPVVPEMRVWFNPSLNSTQYLVPGLIALIMAILAALLTSTTISREWENGTMELLISTPVSSIEIILGKFIPYFVIGLLDTVIIISMGYFAYHVPIKGSLILLCLIIVLFLTGVLMLGIFISCSFRSSLVSNQMAIMATYIPTMLLSGFVFYIPGMPKFLQILSIVIPAKYFITCTRGIYSKGVGLSILLPDFIFLLVFDIIMIVLATTKFKKSLDE